MEKTLDESTEIGTQEQALEALESYDPALTKRALRFLVDQGDPRVLPRVLPLSQHPDAAIRFVAKRAIKELRALPMPATPVSPVPGPDPEVAAEAVPQVVGGVDLGLLGMDPRLEALLEAPARKRPRRPREGGVPLRWFDLEL